MTFTIQTRAHTAAGIFLLCAMLAQAEIVTLAWSPSADTNVIGYNLYHGVASRTYTNKLDVGSALTATVSNLVEGTTYYFSYNAYNLLGMESDFSEEVSYHVPAATWRQVVNLTGSGVISNAIAITGPWTWLADLQVCGRIALTNPPAPQMFFQSNAPKELAPLAISSFFILHSAF
jgi:hypothetical protein